MSAPHPRAAVALLTALLLAAAPASGDPGHLVDAREGGLSLAWLIFGFAAQAVFALRFLIQWIASERARESIVPRSFWLLSIVGGSSLFVYFLRRGDPVGMVGQAFGLLVYARNLYLLERKRRAPGRATRQLRPELERPASRL